MLRYTWVLRTCRGTIEVSLTAEIDSSGPATRLALLLGARRCLRRGVIATLAARTRTTLRIVEGNGHERSKTTRGRDAK